jgi:phytoene dehydrogenase-like protein
VPVETYDAVVVGSGPNGLAAALEIARSGHAVLVLEAQPTAGGGTRTAELTLPGFRHDVCSAVHPLGVASPFFRTLPLGQEGLEWVHPPVPLAHPLDDGTAVLLARDLDETGLELGRRDGDAYRRLLAPLLAEPDALLSDALGPLRVPRHPVLLARFGRHGLRSAAGLASGVFTGERARALFGGLAAHSILPLERSPTAAFGLVLALLGHAAGWPIARGGSQAIADAMVSHLRSLGGRVECGRPVTSLHELPPSRAVLLDVARRGLLQLAGARLPSGYRRRLERFRHGPGVFKLDLALDGPIPWRAAECARAGTVHVGGTLGEIAQAVSAVWKGAHPEKPFVLVAQQSLFDETRAPAGKQTVWAYCHVPNGSPVDMTDRIEAQIERFAPGFGERILARHALGPAALEAYNPNYVGGDINAGAQDLRQLFTRPVPALSPYRTPLSGVYLCSASTPPGGGVHGLCGHFAALAALAGPLRA